jgi:high-affinity K+ transport system ATPase subunit B
VSFAHFKNRSAASRRPAGSRKLEKTNNAKHYGVTLLDDMTSRPIATKFNLMIRQWTLTFMPAASDAIVAATVSEQFAIDQNVAVIPVIH